VKRGMSRFFQYRKSRTRMRMVPYTNLNTLDSMPAINRKCVSLLLKIVVLLWLAVPLCLHADSIVGTVADPSGALIAAN
jgi:hypothetical protein